MSDPPTAKELEEWGNYLNALESDLVGKCRSIVSTCRASGQHRQALLKKIDEDQSDIAETLLLSPLQKVVLQDIHQVLQVAHLAQELLSAERTPTLSMAFPVFKTLIFKWKALATTIPELKHFIDLGVSKLEEYAGRARKTCLYSLAMILNPGQKFTWFAENDKSGQDELNARNWILEAMLSFKQHQCTNQPISSHSQPTAASRKSSPSELASTNIAHGYSRLQSLNVGIRRSSSLINVQTPTQSSPSTSSSRSQTPLPIQPHQETAEEIATRKMRELAEDKAHVERELSRYEAAGIITSFENSGMINIDEFWSTYEYEYPFLFRVAMDRCHLIGLRKSVGNDRPRRNLACLASFRRPSVAGAAASEV
ncbi:hypothetical protein BJ912DRAFT_923235 [Pholiota molesta]|nr:hypothetical protein BJ912DRAFT_923235 [Pholiota molesta]